MEIKTEFIETELKGAFVIQPLCIEDERGKLIKDYSIEVFQANGIGHCLKEVFYTHSKTGVLRAIHFQNPKQQAKLIRCIKGCVYDVIVDLRENSLTFGRWAGFELSENNMKSIYVPKHFGHGYLVLQDSIIAYLCDEVFYPEYDSGIFYNDPEINIDWPFEKIGGVRNLIISQKDIKLQSFSRFCEQINI